jgi:hypothetical protein
MRLPDGSILMHDAVHAYDPIKAHEYYIRNRKLKGRKKGGQAAIAKQSRKDWSTAPNFIKNLPMAQEGGSREETERFVKWAQGKTDDELIAAAAKIKKERGDNDFAAVATINALLKNRQRVRRKAGTTKTSPRASKKTAGKSKKQQTTARGALAVASLARTARALR